jgi:hypothetical protein
VGKIVGVGVAHKMIDAANLPGSRELGALLSPCYTPQIRG